GQPLPGTHHEPSMGPADAPAKADEPSPAALFLGHPSARDGDPAPSGVDPLPPPRHARAWLRGHDGSPDPTSDGEPEPTGDTTPAETSEAALEATSEAALEATSDGAAGATSDGAAGATSPGPSEGPGDGNDADNGTDGPRQDSPTDALF
ncbi:MAG TPA: hypothetical protein VJ978_04785, partial [Nitriliruptoraceae bacterium]|nr:hypothetical protein [Nitriliruptoraceae bacterium]